jgi:hypothetical protein
MSWSLTQELITPTRNTIANQLPAQLETLMHERAVGLAGELGAPTRMMQTTQVCFSGIHNSAMQ